MDLPIQVTYGHPSVFYQKEGWLSPVGTRLLALELHDSKEHIPSVLDL